MVECNAKDMTCHKCQKKGHIAPACLGGPPPLRGQRQQVSTTGTPTQSRPQSPETDDEDTKQTTKTAVILHKVSRVKLADPTPRLLCKIEPTSGSKPGTPFEYEVLPDTGATISVISADIARSYGLTIRSSSEQLLTADDSRLKVLGCTRVKINGTQVRALVTNALQDDILISWRDMIRLSIIPEDFPQPQTSTLRVCKFCLLYTSPSPRDKRQSRMPSSA